MKKSHKIKSMSIRSIFFMIFMGLMMAGIFITGLVILTNGYASIERGASAMSVGMNQNISKKIAEFSLIPASVTDVTSRLVENGLIDLTNTDDLEGLFFSALTTYGNAFYSIGYGTVDGEYYAAYRGEDEELAYVQNDKNLPGQAPYFPSEENWVTTEVIKNKGSFDPRERLWYQEAIRANALVVSPVFAAFSNLGISVSTAVPVYDEDDQLRGVLVAHMRLSDLNSSLSDIASASNGYAVIIEKNTGYLIANSANIENAQDNLDGTLTRKTLEDLDNSIFNQLPNYNEFSDGDAFTIKSENEKWYVDVQEYQHNGIDWMTISLLPESYMAGGFSSNIWITVVSVIVVGIASLFVYWVASRKLFAPIRSLLAAAKTFSAGDLKQRVQIIRNDEVGFMSEIFNSLADQIQQQVNNLEETVAIRTYELNESNTMLEKQRNQLRLILNSTAEGVFGIDLEGKCTFYNKSFLTLLRYKDEESLLGKEMRDLIHPSNHLALHNLDNYLPVTEYLQAGEAGRPEQNTLWRADGSFFDIEYRILPQIRHGKKIGYVISFIDITERKKAEQQIEYLSFHDSLTGLYNRTFFDKKMMEIDTPLNLPISVLYMDMNGLKLLNDTFGHTAGDELLVKTAKILKRNCRENDIAARVGGDEFVILFPCTIKDDAVKVMAKLKEELASQKIKMIPFSMAAGVATKQKHWQSLQQILENAEHEMYHEKNVSSKSFCNAAVSDIMKALHEKSAKERQHSEQVSLLCEMTGRAMGLSETIIRQLRDAGWFHDIGKITLDDSLLFGCEREQTEAGRELVRQHPIVGYRILNLSPATLDIAGGVYSHHERWDGRGYPKGLQGEEIPLISRIISVSENYERALNLSGDTEEGRKQALQVIAEGSGKQFDPDIASFFIKMMKNNKQ
ncbi:diguanylate cyclase [Scatolibacter rhodanostii]|uniref:diguanylate cyclase n=1 Tax=Scatolibacter rhodanostii TaxID=2014781 RepID=UPI000C06D00E|nr:diguanylate cyclase [Scatolibacter rhodanostii]